MISQGEADRLLVELSMGGGTMNDDGINRDELTVMIFALRYALPRHTYAPEIACNYIAGKITQMTVQQIKQLIKELDYAEKYSMYGDEEARVTGYQLLHKLMDALDGEAEDDGD